MKNSPVNVGIACALVVREPGTLISYALGSCVGVCLFDHKKHIAGMAHILLPSYKDAVDRQNLYKFADSGCELLLYSMLRKGAGRDDISARLVGGARMFRTGGSMEGIGERNVNAAREALHRLGIQITAEDTGKDYGRTVTLDSETGEVTVKAVNGEIKKI